jgi:hypothetical protein
MGSSLDWNLQNDYRIIYGKNQGKKTLRKGKLPEGKDYFSSGKA